MSIIFALLSTCSIGLSDFYASNVTKRTRANEVSSTVLFAGLIVMAASSLFWTGHPTNSDLLHGALAGVANGLGVLLLLFAYSRASLGSTAPTAAVIMSSMPVLWDVLVSGNSPSTIASIGLVLGVIAIAMTSYERRGPESNRGGLIFAILSGLVFGVMFVQLSYISNDAGGSPLLVQRGLAFLVAMAVTRSTGPRIFPAKRRDFLVAFAAGLFAIAAVIVFVLALRGGSLAVVSILASQYAAVAVLLGVLFRGQRLWWCQGVGLAASSIAVALIALG
ncbi:MAG: DMT family transporter [Acidimicrobiales bacterium]|nr:DMT family transporter [Acidimicrobiales bacterium]